ncbi:MAG: preprotein translocase subunit Sec61beta [Thermoplasmata archaeon]
MPKESKKEGFHSAAGLIRYFDLEDEKALKVNPRLVVIFGILLIAIVAYAEWQWGG